MNGMKFKSGLASLEKLGTTLTLLMNGILGPLLSILIVCVSITVESKVV